MKPRTRLCSFGQAEEFAFVWGGDMYVSDILFCKLSLMWSVETGVLESIVG